MTRFSLLMACTALALHGVAFAKPDDQGSDTPAPKKKPSTKTAENQTATTSDPAVTEPDRAEAVDQAQRQSEIEAAEQVTATAEEEGRLPETMAIANPPPATQMDSGSGAFVEPAVMEAVPADHPSVENNPREGTSAIQNGGDFNDPRGRHPTDQNFAGQGLDMSVYGKAAE